MVKINYKIISNLELMIKNSTIKITSNLSTQIVGLRIKEDLPIYFLNIKI